MNRYEDLVVWQVAHQLALDLYRDTVGFPRDERFGLIQQIRRSASSVPCNIAEGSGRFTPGEFRNQVSVAGGSIMEVDYQVRLSADLGFMSAPVAAQRRETCDRVGKMLYRLYHALGRK